VNLSEKPTALFCAVHRILWHILSRHPLWHRGIRAPSKASSSINPVTLWPAPSDGYNRRDRYHFHTTSDSDGLFTFPVRREVGTYNHRSEHPVFAKLDTKELTLRVGAPMNLKTPAIGGWDRHSPSNRPG